MHTIPARPRILIVTPPELAEQAHQTIFDLYGHPGWFRSISESEMTTTRAVEYHFASSPAEGFDGILYLTVSGINGTGTPTSS